MLNKNLKILIQTTPKDLIITKKSITILMQNLYKKNSLSAIYLNIYLITLKLVISYLIIKIINIQLLIILMKFF